MAQSNQAFTDILRLAARRLISAIIFQLTLAETVPVSFVGML